MSGWNALDTFSLFMTLENDHSPRSSALPIDRAATRPFPSVSQTLGPPFPPTSAPSASSSSSSSSGGWLPVVPDPLSPRSGRHQNTQLSEDTIKLARQLVGERGFEISRHGLTAATTRRDHQIAGVKLPNHVRSHIGSPGTASASSPVLPWTSAEDSRSVRSDSSSSQGKRPPQDSEFDGPFRTPSKKARLGPPGNLSLPVNHIAQKPEDRVVPGGVTSPLFFSHSAKKHMTGRIPSFSASQPTAAMLERFREEGNSVTTVKLPKGQVGSASPARGHNMSTPGSVSADSHQSQQTPDSRALPSHLRGLQGIDIVEVLEQDERPTFIIDLTDPANFGPGQLQPLFANASLRASRAVYELLSDNSERNSDFARFKAWVVSFVRDNRSMDVCLPSLSYGGISWTCSTLRNRFRFVSGNTAAVSITPTSPNPPAQASSVLDQRSRGPTTSRDHPTPGRDRALSETDYFGEIETVRSHSSSRRAHSEPRAELRPDTPSVPTEPKHGSDLEMEYARPSFDWTRIPDISSMSQHMQFARSVDWSSTPLGPIEDWGADLRAMSNLIMGSPHPAAMWWGPEYIAIYNEAYIGLAGKKHPRLMGMSYVDAWAEIWDEIKSTFDSAWFNGQATMKHDDRLFIVRNGYLEETYFNWSIVPLVGDDGSVIALYNPAFENTRRKVNERRMFTLREVGQRISQAKDVKSFWSNVRKGLEYNPFDIPFALIYSVTEDSESEVSSMHSGSALSPPQIYLEGSIGVPDDHPCAPSSIDLRTSTEGFAASMRESMSLPGNPIVLSKEAGTLPQSLIDGLEWRGFGDPSRTIVTFPVHPTTGGDSIVGFIVMGINPRRPYDQDYRLFVNLLSRQLATSMASVVLFEEEIKRGQRAARLAALDRQQLSLQLRLRTQEAVDSEYRFTRMAEFAPVGIFIANAQGLINFCNDSWWEISRHPRSVNTINTWMDSVRDEDRPTVESAWKKLITDRVSITQEFRFKNSREADGHPIDTWVLMSAYPEKDSDGSVKAIFGCVTDISQQKWAETFQKQRREEALELKRQQENFIDITSHEMRNPLSAILQCADEITSSISTYRKSDPETLVPGNLSILLDSCVEAANTITLCASHQRRIVDDVLTLSKLDSQLLYVTPVDVQPVFVIETVLKMFEPELASNGIQGEFRIDKSYQDMNVNWAKLDPSRLRQVLINLMTNSIKFTQNRDERSIVITLGASTDISEAPVAGLDYFPGDRPDREDFTNKPEWGEGEKFNLHISVSDTGPGLDEQERTMLFQRFSQTSPRTHVQYGGSGLGLFISRTLTELQGGQIGVLSSKGVGSTFAFYIKSRKVELPDLSPTTVMPPRSSLVGHNQVVQYTTQKPKSPRLVSQSSEVLPEETAAGSYPNHLPLIDILLVEDNIVNQKVLDRQLRKANYNTFLANHGGEAIEALRRSNAWNEAAATSHAVSLPRPQIIGRPRDNSSASRSSATSGDSGDRKGIHVSIILMDLEMPVMDGLTCAKKIRELESQGVLNWHLPIIAVTAYARPEQIENAKAAGMDDVVSKPFRMRDLTPKITELVAKHGTNVIAPTQSGGGTD